MGGLRNSKAWDELPIHVIRALERVVADRRFHLTHRDWFVDGRSDEPVASVVRQLENTSGADHRVLKFFSKNGEDRINRLQIALESSAEFDAHLAHPERSWLKLDDWRAVFMEVAGGDLEHVGALSSLISDRKLPDYCASIVRSVVGDWNGNRPLPVQRTVGDLVDEVLGHRKAEVIAWASDAGIPVDGSSDGVVVKGWPPVSVNPFALLSGAWSASTLDMVLTGKAHGDLSGRNILLPLRDTVEPSEFVLIDYDRFRDDAPLARDPMHLLVALVLDQIGQLGYVGVSTELAQALVHPERDGLPTFFDSHRQLARQIRNAPDLRSVAFPPEWRQQCLLFLAAAGLLHLGRDLRVDDKQKTKEWCFHLAALAAERLIPSLPEPTFTAACNTAEMTSGGGKLVGRADQSQRIRTLLTDGQPGVAVVSGSPGVGKTCLFEEVVGGLPTESSDEGGVLIRRHEATADAGLDTRTLIGYLEGGSNWAERHGSSVVRLQNVLRRLGDTKVVLVVDAAENLLKPGTRTLADADLDRALELLATDPDHRVKVVLVSQDEPANQSDDPAWPDERVVLPRLKEEDYPVFLATLGCTARWDVERLDESARRALHKRMQGNPRLGELAHAVVALDQAGPDLPELADLLRKEQSNVWVYLIRRLLQGIGTVQLRVIEALVVLGTPVPVSMVESYLDDPSPEFPAAVRQALDELVKARVIQEAVPDLYQVRPSYEAELMKDELRKKGLPPERFARAAKLLTGLETYPVEMSQLRASFVELRALLQAEQYVKAGKTIEGIDSVLIEWNGRHRLLDQRRQVAGNLGDLRAEVHNYNVLGQIYVSVDNFEEADKAYGRALQLARQSDDVDVLELSVKGNIATMHWLQNDTDFALAEYEYVRDLALELRRDMERMTAVEGIADCHRRNGDYDNAIANGRAAIELSVTPALHERADIHERTVSKRVNVALKLARWCAELGQLSEAEDWLELARLGSIERGDHLYASWLDGQAVARLDRGDTAAAKEIATEAVELAMEQYDEVILMQARTTLVYIHVVSGEFTEAWREARMALQFRKPYRALIVLALAALAAHRAGALSRARTLFDELADDARTRISHNSRDFTAQDMLAFAICGQRQHAEVDLGPAVKALVRAREIVVPPPKLRARLQLMMNELAPGSDVLRPVLDVL